VDLIGDHVADHDDNRRFPGRQDFPRYLLGHFRQVKYSQFDNTRYHSLPQFMGPRVEYARYKKLYVETNLSWPISSNLSPIAWEHINFYGIYFIKNGMKIPDLYAEIISKYSV